MGPEARVTELLYYQDIQAFRRGAYSSLIFRLADASRFDAVKREIESDPRLTLEAKREAQFYADQSETLAKFIGILGTSISVIFSIGAVIGAMITMYASVASRTAEIGTLRALGFPRGAILVAFLVEALALGLLGGVLGLVAASFMQAFTVSTTNFQTFAELAFSFTLTPRIVVGLARLRARDGLRRRLPARGAGLAAVDRLTPAFRERGIDGLVTAAGESIREVLFQPDSPFGKQEQSHLQALMVDDVAALKRNLARRDEGPDAGPRK